MWMLLAVITFTAFIAISAVVAYTLIACAFVGGCSAPEELAEEPLQWHAPGEAKGTLLDSAPAQRA